MSSPAGAYGPDGGKRLESKCALCSKRVWWCLRPLPNDYPQPYDDNGKKHLETCKYSSNFNWKDSYPQLREFLLTIAGPPIKKDKLEMKI